MSRFEPLSPVALASRLARHIDALSAGRLRIGLDGDDTVGTAELADRVAAAVTALDRPAIRVSTRWWWRAASLRLEYGREDLESRMTGWVDADALRREVLDPLAPTGSGRYLTRLRDPERDRAVRDSYRVATDRAVLIMDGPLLLTSDLPLDEVIRIGVSPGRLARVLPADRQWERDAFAAYQQQYELPAVVVSYDHPDAPAARGLPPGR